MKAVSLSEFFENHKGTRISRAVCVYNLILAYRDLELPGRDVYYLLDSRQYTAWADYTFFHISQKRTFSIPALTAEAVRLQIMSNAVPHPEEEIREFLWNHFRINPRGQVSEVTDATDVIAYYSPEHESNTACQMKYYNVDFSSEDMTRAVQNRRSFPFSEEELRQTVHGVQFSNAVQLWFTEEHGTRLSRAVIHDLHVAIHQSEEVTVLFSDMRDFSELVKETHQVFSDERALVEFRILCKRYQLIMCRAIRVQGGTIVHTAGDAFVTVFRGIDAASRALAAAREMLTSVANLRKNVEFNPLKSSFVTRIGISTGKAECGYLGPYELKEMTVFGLCVNIGSRLEGAVKQFSPTGGVLLTAETAERVKDFQVGDFQEVSVPVKELKDPLKCYLLPMGT